MSKQSILRRLALVMTIAFLAGCGAEAPSMSPNAGKNSRDLVLNAPSNGVNQQQQVDYRQILSEVSRMYQQTNTISAQIICFDTNNGKTVSSRSMSYFSKPSKLSLQVLEHTDGKAVGTKIVHLGSGKAKVKTKFFGLQVKVDLDLSDSRMCNLRGDTLQDTGIVKMMSVLLDESAQVRVLGQGSLSGVPVTMLEVVSRQSLRGITREVFGIDNTRKMPVIREMYQGSKLVFRTQFSNIVPNATLPTNAFTLD